MKFSITAYHAVATWKWDTSTEPHKQYHYAKTNSEGVIEDDDDEDDDDVCGICQAAYESCCPICKVPGDDCPLSELILSQHAHLPHIRQDWEDDGAR